MGKAGDGEGEMEQDKGQAGQKETGIGLLKEVEMQDMSIHTRRRTVGFSRESWTSVARCM